MVPIAERNPKHNSISEFGIDFGTGIRKYFPDAIGAAVCAFGIVTSYSDKKTGYPIADILYNYPNDGKYRMFGYNYKLVWRQ